MGLVRYLSTEKAITRMPTKQTSNFNRGMTMNGKPVTVPKSPAFKPSKVFCVPEDILFYAFRYALGRMTYAVADVASEIRAHNPTLSNKTRALIIKEIKEAEAADGLGMDMDRKEWLKTLTVLEGGKIEEE